MKSRRSDNLDKIVKERVLNNAKIFLDGMLTVREVAKITKVSKSTVHDDLKVKLEKIDSCLYQKVSEQLEHNKQVRHIRGGLATRKKYKNINQ